MTSHELYLLLAPHIKKVTGVPLVIKAAQNAPAPAGSYASLLVKSHIAERGTAFKRYDIKPDDDRTLEFTNNAQLVITCVVEFFRDGAKDYASKLLQIQRREDVIWDLYANKINLLNTSNVIDLTALQANTFEERARVELTTRGIELAKYDINRILTVPIEVSNEEGHELLTVTVELER